LGKEQKEQVRSSCWPGSNCADVNSLAQEECTNTPVPIDPIPTSVVAKIPVVLAELTIQINMDSLIDLPEPALEIKQIKKNVKLTQCLLLQDNEQQYTTNTNKLFIRGFVRKNIDYSTRECSDSEGVCGDLKHCTVDVPFRCVTPVTFNGTPPAPVVFNTLAEFGYFKREDLTGPEFAEKDELLSSDLSEFNQESSEFFNERPFCELIKSRIVEFDEYVNRTRPEGVELPFEEKEFTQIEEKMVVYLTLKILQNRQVYVPYYCHKELCQE